MKKKGTKRSKKKKFNKKIFVLIFIILLLLGCLILWIFLKPEKNNNNTDSPVQIKDNMENYDYYLTDNATSYYEELYGELKKILNEDTVDDKAFAEMIAKLFITDVFTLDNKVSSSDIGGLQFIHSKFKDDFINIAKTTLYSSVQSNIYGDRKQKLPVVTNVEIKNTKTSTFTYKKEQYDSYVINASISYKTDLKYPSSYKVTLIKNDKYWQVVSGE